MRRRRTLLAALLPALASLLLTAVFAQDVQLDQRVFEIGRQLRCPVCVSESVADSNAQIAQEMRQLIQQQLKDGKSETQIIAYFKQRYGDWILLDPPKRGLHLLVWVLPIAAAVIGVLVLALLVRRWRAHAEEPIVVDRQDLTRVRRALEVDED